MSLGGPRCVLVYFRHGYGGGVCLSFSEQRPILRCRPRRVPPFRESFLLLAVSIYLLKLAKADAIATDPRESSASFNKVPSPLSVV